MYYLSCGHWVDRSTDRCPRCATLRRAAFQPVGTSAPRRSEAASLVAACDPRGGLALRLLALVAVIGLAWALYSVAKSTLLARPSSRVTVTADAYARVRPGMSFRVVDTLMGSPNESKLVLQVEGPYGPKPLSRSLCICRWRTQDGATAVVTFQRGRVVHTYQSGLCRLPIPRAFHA